MKTLNNHQMIIVYIEKIICKRYSQNLSRHQYIYWEIKMGKSNEWGNQCSWGKYLWTYPCTYRQESYWTQMNIHHKMLLDIYSKIRTEQLKARYVDFLR